jgi:hypothetical protein
MKTVSDRLVREELIERIKSLSKDHKGQWGRMNLFQMVRHNTCWNGWILGKDHHTYKQVLMGKIFGKMALRKMIKGEKPLDKNIPTSSQFKVKEKNGDLEAEKLKWILLTKAYENYDNPDFIHDFFGKMTKCSSGKWSLLVNNQESGQL